MFSKTWYGLKLGVMALGVVLLVLWTLLEDLVEICVVHVLPPLMLLLLLAYAMALTDRLT
ncbi:MAG: hypothetical protein KA296_13715 [Marinobacter sp.]|nr:hypothetical protein [Marinobacter sp.]